MLLWMFLFPGPSWKIQKCLMKSRFNVLAIQIGPLYVPGPHNPCILCLKMYIQYVLMCVRAKHYNPRVVWLTFMTCDCSNKDHSTVWAKGCGCPSARALWCHQWNCQSTPSPAARRTCWLLKIQGRSGQSEPFQSSTLTALTPLFWKLPTETIKSMFDFIA